MDEHFASLSPVPCHPPHHPHTFRPDVFTFSSVISACNTGAAEGQASPFAFHSSLQTIDPLLGPSDAPPPPPPPSHAVPNWTRALRLFQDMRKMKIEANLVAYTSLITTLQRAGQLDQALTIFSEMEGRGIVPDVVAYNNMIAACSREGRWERAWALFNEMRRAGIQPSTVSYNALISACEKGNQPDRALEVFKYALIIVFFHFAFPFLSALNTITDTNHVFLKELGKI